MDKTYIELNKNDKPTVQINAWTTDGNSFSPSAAYYTIYGARKNNELISKTPATVSSNHISARLELSITASASEYEINWELHKNGGDIIHHCTEVLVKEC